jgi:hypothetical protein
MTISFSGTIEVGSLNSAGGVSTVSLKVSAGSLTVPTEQGPLTVELVKGQTFALSARASALVAASVFPEGQSLAVEATATT